MDKITKFLKKLSKKERAQILRLFLRIQNLDLKGLKITPLKGYKNMYRIREKKIRIIFFKDTKNHKGIITAINFRNKIYKEL